MSTSTNKRSQESVVTSGEVVRFVGVGVVVLILVAAAAFMQVLEEERDRWLTEPPPGPQVLLPEPEPEPLVPPEPEQVVIEPQVLIQGAPAPGRSTESVVVVPSRTVVERRTVVTRERTRDGRGNDGNGGNPPPPREDDDREEVACVARVCVTTPSATREPAPVRVPLPVPKTPLLSV